MENLAELMEIRDRSIEALKRVQYILDERVKNKKETNYGKEINTI